MGPRASSKRPLRSILDRFCKVLRGVPRIFGEGLGRDFEGFFQSAAPCLSTAQKSPEGPQKPPEGSSRFPEFYRESFELFLTASTKQRGGGLAKRTKFKKQRAPNERRTSVERPNALSRVVRTAGKLLTFSDLLGCVWMRSDAFGCVQML